MVIPFDLGLQKKSLQILNMHVWGHFVFSGYAVILVVEFSLMMTGQLHNRAALCNTKYVSCSLKTHL